MIIALLLVFLGGNLTALGTAPTLVFTALHALLIGINLICLVALGTTRRPAGEDAPC